MTQEIFLHPLGLITEPNKHGTFPNGALQTALNVRIRHPQLLETVEQFKSVRTLTSWNANFGAYLFQGDTRKVAILKQQFDSQYYYSWENGTTFAAPQLFGNEIAAQTLDDQGRFDSTTTRGRLLVACKEGVVIFDAPNPSAPRLAGILPPLITGFFITGGAIPSATPICHVVGVFRRVFSDGYEISSAPSAAAYVYSAGGNISYSVFFDRGFAKVGDYIDFYRTRAQDEGVNTGADYYRSASYQLTSTDVSNGFISYGTIIDSANDATLGEALYTNPGQQGAAAAHRLPPTCKCIATFKGYTFYLNRTDAPQFSFRIPVFWGEIQLSASVKSNDYAHKYGIGRRWVAGNWTSGNPTLTGVSATDILGVVIGQEFNYDGSGSNPFPGGARVTAVGASTITFSANSAITQTSAAGGHAITVDVLEINGTRVLASSLNSLIVNVNPTVGSFSILDRVLPQDYGAGISNPESIPADEVVFSTNFISVGHDTSLTVRATNGWNYVPPLPRIELAETARTYAAKSVPNGVAWSEQNQPEHVAPSSTAFVGSGEIYAAVPTRDALWIFASDGLWRLSGTGGAAGDGYDWRIDPVDPTLFIAGPQALCVLRDIVFAYTNRGFVGITSAGDVNELSKGRIGDQLPGIPWTLPTNHYIQGIVMGADEANDEILMKVTGTPAWVSQSALYLYNTLTDSFVWAQISDSVSAGNIPYTFLFSRTDNLLWVLTQSTTIALAYDMSETSFSPHQAQFQPTYGDNPYSMKHWQSLEASFDTNLGGSQGIGALINASQLPVTSNVQLLNAGYGRWVCSIPRNSPAVANQIAVGFYSPSLNTTKRKLLSMAVRFVELTDQRNKR